MLQRFFVASTILALMLCSLEIAVAETPRIVWTQTNNPSSGEDDAWGIWADGSGLYVAGDDSVQRNLEWRVEKRNLSDGALLWFQQENPSAGADSIWSLSGDTSGIYAVGYDSVPGNLEWRMEKRNLGDGTPMWMQTSNPSAGADVAFGVAVDASGIYVVGVDNSPGNDEWRIEKRSLNDGTLLWNQTSNPSTSMDWALGVAADASGIYVVGYDNAPGDLEWRIEKRNLDDGGLLWTQTSNPTHGEASGIYLGDRAFGVAADSSGIYVVGFDNSPAPDDVEWRIEKRALDDGSLLWNQTENPSPREDRAFSVGVDVSGVYVAGFDSSPGPGDLEWRVEKRNRDNGALVWTQTDNSSVGEDWAWALTVRSSGVYVAGFDSVHGEDNVEWRIDEITEETVPPFYVQPWFTITTIALTVAAVFLVLVVLKKKSAGSRQTIHSYIQPRQR